MLQKEDLLTAEYEVAKKALSEAHKDGVAALTHQIESEMQELPEDFDLSQDEGKLSVEEALGAFNGERNNLFSDKARGADLTAEDVLKGRALNTELLKAIESFKQENLKTVETRDTNYTELKLVIDMFGDSYAEEFLKANNDNMSMMYNSALDEFTPINSLGVKPVGFRAWMKADKELAEAAYVARFTDMVFDVKISGGSFPENVVVDFS